MVSIDAFQALDPGSIPGHRTLFQLSVGLVHSRRESRFSISILNYFWGQTRIDFNFSAISLYLDKILQGFGPQVSSR